MSEKKSKKEPVLLPRNLSFFTDYDSDTDIRTVEYFVEKYVRDEIFALTIPHI